MCKGGTKCKYKATQKSGHKEGTRRMWKLEAGGDDITSKCDHERRQGAPYRRNHRGLEAKEEEEEEGEKREKATDQRRKRNGREGKRGEERERDDADKHLLIWIWRRAAGIKKKKKKLEHKSCFMALTRTESISVTQHMIYSNIIKLILKSQWNRLLRASVKWCISYLNRLGGSLWTKGVYGRGF